MAARVLLSRRAIAPFMAASLVGTALIPTVALAEAPEHHHSKKPIYDDFEPQILKPTSPRPSPFSETLSTAPEAPEAPAVQKAHGPTPTDRLAKEIGKARMFLYRYTCKAEDGVNSAMDSAFHLERSFTETIASLAPPRETGEKLLPGLVYVLVAGMAGSIMTRNRNIVLRASVPIALGIGAGWMVMPITMNNVSNLMWKYEQRFPAVAEAHIKTREGLQKGWHSARTHTEASKQYVNKQVTSVVDAVEDWVKKGR